MRQFEKESLMRQEVYKIIRAIGSETGLQRELQEGRLDDSDQVDTMIQEVENLGKDVEVATTELCDAVVLRLRSLQRGEISSPGEARRGDPSVLHSGDETGLKDIPQVGQSLHICGRHYVFLVCSITI